MPETCKTQDTLFSNSGIAKDRPGRAQALRNVCYALQPRYSLQKDQDILIKQSNILLK